MAGILITGSADGLGQLSARSLADQGHQVVLHARNSECRRYAKQNLPGAGHAIAGDLSNIDEIKNVAHEVNALGRFDAVIHNAGVFLKTTSSITFSSIAKRRKKNNLMIFHQVVFTGVPGGIRVCDA